MHLIYYGSRSKNAGYQQRLFNTWIFLVLLYFRLNSCRLLVYSHSNMSLPSSIPLRVQPLTLLLFIPGWGRCDPAGPSRVPGAVALPQLSTAHAGFPTAFLFLSRSEIAFCALGICAVKDGFVAELKSRGIPSLLGELKKKSNKTFPKEKLLVELHFLCWNKSMARDTGRFHWSTFSQICFILAFL